MLFLVEKSTDVELRDLLLELCQTQPPGSQIHSQSHSHSQSQAYPSSQSQSIGELKLQKLQRSHSLLSAHSLFQEESEGEEEGEEREIEDLSSPENSGDRDRLEGRDMEGDDRVEVDSGDDLFIAMETELDSGKYSSPVVKISVESEQQQQQVQLVTPPKPMTSQSRLHLDLQLNKKGGGGGGGGGGGRRGTPVSPFRSPKPPRLRYKAAEETDEESEVELPISTPLASPMPPSPKSKELQSDILKELDSFSSGCSEVGRELEVLGGLTDSQFGVPYSQLQTPSTSQYSKSHPELDKVWNSTAAAAVVRENPLDTQSPLKLAGEGTGVGGGRGIGLGQSVQLEYDMPEITDSQLETSSDPLFIAPLENDSPRSSLTKGHLGACMKGQSSSSRGQSPLVMHQQTSSSTSSLRKAKRQLLGKPAAGGSGGKGASSKKSIAGRTRSKRKHKDRDIPQLDGTDDRQLPSSATTTLSRKRKRTLGVQHKRKKQTKSTVEAQLLNEGEVGSASSEVEEQLTSLPEAAVEETMDTREREEVLPSSAAALLLNEGKGTTAPAPVLPQEEDDLCGVNVECGLVEMEVWESGQGESCEVSGDEESGQQSTSSREKARLSLSLKKSANRTHRTRESDPDLVVAETVINPSWRAEGEDALRGSEVVPGPSSPVRTRERATLSEVASSPSRKVSQHLKEKVLRCRPILKLDKLSTRLSMGRSMKENAVAAASTKDAREQVRKKPSSKRRKTSATSMSSGSSEADVTNEREKRYKKRCRERSTRNKWSPKFLLGMSYEQQLKKAIEISKQTYVAESPQQQLQYDAESADQLQDDAESAQSEDGAESIQLYLSGGGQEGSGGLEWEEPGELGPGSPLMFSPPSTGDADRTIIEESPLREEERGLDNKILNVDDFLEKSCMDEKREGEETETAAAVIGEGINEWNLDMSISSISESPPYSSSPALAAEGGGRERERGEGEKDEEELLHDSTLKLELETSFTEVSSPPPQSSSPIPVTPKPPFDVDSSFLSEDSFPCVSLVSNSYMAAKEATGDTNNQTTLAVPSDPTAKVTVEDDEDNLNTSSQPTTPLKLTHAEMEAATSHDDPNQPLLSDYPPIASMLRSPEGSESQSEAEQILPSQQQQVDVSIVSEEDFHLSIGSCSSSSHEDELEGGRDSSDPLNFSIEKTSRAVRLEQYLQLPRESEYQVKDEVDRRPPHTLQVERGETAASNVVELGDDDGSELAPPTHRELAESASSYGLPSMRHQEPFYSCPTDVQRPL